MANAVKQIESISSGGVPGGGAWVLYQIFNDEPIVSAAVVDSIFHIGGNPGLGLGEFSTFGVWSKLTGSTPDVTLSVLNSFDQTPGNFVIPDVGGQIVRILDTNAHANVATPTALPYLRFRAAGGAGNGADVKITSYLWMRTS